MGYNVGQKHPFVLWKVSPGALSIAYDVWPIIAVLQPNAAHNPDRLFTFTSADLRNTTTNTTYDLALSTPTRVVYGSTEAVRP